MSFLQTTEIGQLRQVLLLHRYHHCYKLTEVRVGHYEDKASFELYVLDYTAKLDQLSYKAPSFRIQGRAKIDVTVGFSSSIFGSFAQCVLFDFGKKPYLVQRLNVDVCSKDVSDKLLAARHEVGQQHQMWDENSTKVIRFVSTSSEAVQREQILKRYSLPKRQENVVSAQVMTGEALRINYKRVMHQLLFIEETYMRQQIGR